MAQAGGIPKDRWSKLLAPLLDDASAAHRESMSNEDRSNYDLVKEALLLFNEFNREYYRQQWSRKNFHNKSSEWSYQRLVNELEGTFIAWKKLEGNTTNWVIREQFLQVINPKVSNYVLLQNPNTAKEAHQIATRYHAQHQHLPKGNLGDQAGISNAKWKPNRFDSKAGQGTGPRGKERYPNRFDGKHEPPKEGYKDLSNGLGLDRKEPIMCFSCGKKGHIKRNCPNQNQKENLYIESEETEKPRRVFPGTIFGKRVERMLIDSGAKQSVVAKKWAPDNLPEEGQVFLKGIFNGNPLSLKKIAVRVEGRSVKQLMAIHPTLNYDAILGKEVDGILDLLKGGPPWIPNEGTPDDRPPKQANEDTSEHEFSPHHAVTALEIQEKQDTSDNETDQTSASQHSNRARRRPRRRRKCARNTNYVNPTSSDSSQTPNNRHVRESSPEQEKSSTSSQSEDDTPSQLSSDEEQNAQELPTKGQQKLMDEQATDPSLAGCLAKAELKRGDFMFKEGLLFRRWTPPSTNAGVLQVVLPRSYRETAMKMGDFSPFAGHFGRRKTMSKVMAKFFWPKMRLDIKTMCRGCEACQRTAKKTHKRYPLVPLPVINTPFSRVVMDLVGPLPRTSEGHKFILVLCDYATRYPEAVPLKSTTSLDIAKAMTMVFARTGFPEEVLTDRGSNFCSEVMEGVFKIMGTRHIKTSAYHPECDGLVEWFNGTLKKSLQKYALTAGKEWQDSLPYILFAYREMLHSATGHTPFELLYGRNPRGPINVLYEEWLESTPELGKDVVSYLQDVYLQLEKTHESARHNEKKAKDSMKVYHDRRAKERSLKPNDLVRILVPTRRNKLEAEWDGPFKIESKLSKTTYKVRTGPRQSQVKTLHVNMMAEWQSPTAACFLVETEEIPTCDSRMKDEKVNVNEELSRERTKEMTQVTKEFEEILSNVPGHTNLTEISIETGDAKPIARPAYQVPHANLPGMREEIADLQRNGIIVPSHSEWASPAIQVSKKDGTKSYA